MQNGGKRGNVGGAERVRVLTDDGGVWGGRKEVSNKKDTLLRWSIARRKGVNKGKGRRSHVIMRRASFEGKKTVTWGAWKNYPGHLGAEGGDNFTAKVASESEAGRKKLGSAGVGGERPKCSLAYWKAVKKSARRERRRDELGTGVSWTRRPGGSEKGMQEADESGAAFELQKHWGRGGKSHGAAPQWRNNPKE